MFRLRMWTRNDFASSLFRSCDLGKGWKVWKVSVVSRTGRYSFFMCLYQKYKSCSIGIMTTLISPKSDLHPEDSKCYKFCSCRKENTKVESHEQPTFTAVAYDTEAYSGRVVTSSSSHVKSWQHKTEYLDAMEHQLKSDFVLTHILLRVRDVSYASIHPYDAIFSSSLIETAFDLCEQVWSSNASPICILLSIPSRNREYLLMKGRKLKVYITQFRFIEL